jgi:hypothetical protein
MHGTCAIHGLPINHHWFCEDFWTCAGALYDWVCHDEKDCADYECEHERPVGRCA